MAQKPRKRKKTTKPVFSSTWVEHKRVQVLEKLHSETYMKLENLFYN